MTDTAIQKIDERGIVLANMGDVQRLALELVRSSMCPSQYRNKPGDAIVAIIAGRAVGLSPLQSLTGIAVIGGRASMFGEARAAVVLASGKAEWVKEWYELDGAGINPQGKFTIKTAPDTLTACWRAKRTDQSEPSEVVRYAVGDAKQAGLFGKGGPWTQYWLRMLRMRARAFGERDYFADALHGIAQAEEMQDIKRHGKDKLEVLDGDDDAPAESVEAEIVENAPPAATDAPQSDEQPQADPTPAPTLKAAKAAWWKLAQAAAKESPDEWKDLKANAGKWFEAFASSVLGHSIGDCERMGPEDLAAVIADMDENHDARPRDER